MSKFCKDCDFYMPMTSWENHEKAVCTNPDYQDQPVISLVTGENLTPYPQCYTVRSNGLKCGTQGNGYRQSPQSVAHPLNNILDRLTPPVPFEPDEKPAPKKHWEWFRWS